MRLLLILCLSLLPASLTQAEEAPMTSFILLRHAEKSTAPEAGKDPPLSEAGIARAQRIAQRLKDADIAAVYATQYRRTQNTAAPTAQQHGLPVQVLWMGKRDLREVAADLRDELLRRHRGRTVLIIGHSNTVPIFVEAFSGQSAAAMPESEFDRWSEVCLGADGRVLLSVSAF